MTSRLTTEQFIERARAAHDDKYDYSKSVYITAKSKILITCPTHGDFEQMAARHMKCNGCSKCAYAERGNSMRRSDTEFITQAKAAHGDTYDYSEVRFTSIGKHIYPICKHHGKFKQRAGNHLRGQDCPKCGVWNKTKNTQGHLYVLPSLCGKYIKIGVANDVSRRVERYIDQVPFEFSVSHSFKFERGGAAMELEELYSQMLTSAGFCGFDGATEWFIRDEEIMERLVNFAEAASKSTWY